MRHTVIALTLLLAAQEATADTWPKIKTNIDGSQVYQYQNGTTCIKHADYATERTISGKASITQVFSAEGNSSQKIVNALAYSPSVSAVQAALFDMCTAYGSGAISKPQYDEERAALLKLQGEVISKEAGNLTVSTKAGPTEETKSPKSAAPDTHSSQDVTKRQPSPEVPKGQSSPDAPKEQSSSGATKEQSSSEPPQSGSVDASSKPLLPATRTDQAKSDPPQEKAKDQPVEGTQPTGTTREKIESPTSKTVQAPGTTRPATVPAPRIFPAGRVFDVNVTAKCLGWDGGVPEDYERKLPISLSFMANGAFESITKTCYGEASSASGKWKRIGNGIAVNVTVKNKNASFFCSVIKEETLSCGNLLALVP